MLQDALSVLMNRGFVRQCTDEHSLQSLLTQKPIYFYAGFDPTADSLHVGSLVPIMAMAHLQRLGHTPIAVIGGGTTMIGDPSGKTTTRRMMTLEEIKQNGVCILRQLCRYIPFEEGKGIFLNNAEWLLSLNYIEFLRDIGIHFRVNEMLRAEAYRHRLGNEQGLSFIEFNYQLLQAYDFLYLFDRHQCVLQVGGDDQWSNILAGSDLIRRTRQHKSFGLTFPLLETAKGQKMGKTEQGTIWLDAKKTSPYAFYQYWINTDDRDVEAFLRYFTFLSLERIKELTRSSGEVLQEAKRVLAFEVTKLAHGEDEARRVMDASHAVFSEGESLENLPTTSLDASQFQNGFNVVDLFLWVNLVSSKGEARRLIQQRGLSLNNETVQSFECSVTLEFFKNGKLLLRRGKKQYHCISLYERKE